MIRAAHSMRKYRKPKCLLRAMLPEVCASIDDILTAPGDPGEVVKDAFPDHLDADTTRAIESRYPMHQRAATSDKILLIWVMKEVCNSPIC